MTERAQTSTELSPTVDGPFDQVDLKLAQGDIQSAQRLLEAVLRAPHPVDTRSVEAGSLLRLAACDLAMSRVQRARSSARRAAVLFREADAPSDEVGALALWSRSSSVLGRNVEAVETALLATHLAEELPAGPWAARAHLSLAIAYCWGQAFAQAETAFDKAAQVLARLGLADAQLEVATERSWGHILHCAAQSEGPGLKVNLYGLGAHLTELESLRSRPAATSLTPGGTASLRESAGLARGLIALWEGHADRARELLAQSMDAGQGKEAAGWLLAAQSWLQAELARSAGDFDAAAMHASRMTEWAHEVEHLPMACLGHRLSSLIFDQQSRPELALVELRRLVQAERAMQSLQLEGRGETVGLLLAARKGASHLQDLAAKSTKFEKWAHEDALTGIPNLRRFNQCLNEWTAAAVDSGKPLCVALIDVDKFRDINNNFDYETGNAALRGIAQEMVAHVRSTDLPARWGGDEFAILFRDTELSAALQVAERIQESVLRRDWGSVAQGLRVSISVGVTKALPGDDKHSLVARSEASMYEQKLARRRADSEQAIPPAVLRKVSSWLRGAKRVVIYVGSGAGESSGALSTGNLAAWSKEDRQSFGHVDGLTKKPEEFARFWAGWRLARQDRQPLPEHKAAIALSRELPQTTFVTERVDGLLGMAGADSALELYGNAFRDRCGNCGRVQPSSERGRCLACHAPGHTIRPDITLLGEEHNHLIYASAELDCKNADVVLVVDSDANTFPGASLLQKADAREVRVVMLGAGERTNRVAADVVINGRADVVLEALTASLRVGSLDKPTNGELSDDGFDILCYLTGQRNDNFGFSFEQAMTWRDWEVERHLGTLPWLFPLPTRSRMNPAAPMPSRHDFDLLAADEQVQQRVRDAFLLMLRFYGFEWQESVVERSAGWRQGFATWVATPSHHDLFISRILGALTLFGFRAEATAFMQAAEAELREYRGEDVHGPLWHWRLAVYGNAPASGATRKTAAPL